MYMYNARPAMAKGYNRETLEVRFKGQNINDVLKMTINQAVEFFASVPSILRKLKTLQDVGLGYITAWSAFYHPVRRGIPTGEAVSRTGKKGYRKNTIYPG